MLHDSCVAVLGTMSTVAWQHSYKISVPLRNDSMVTQQSVTVANRGAFRFLLDTNIHVSSPQAIMTWKRKCRGGL